MTVTDFIREKILQHGSGIFLSTLLADILTLVILVCLITMLVYPAAKNMIELRAMANQVGGPKSHWFWGDVKQVTNKLNLQKLFSLSRNNFFSHSVLIK